MTTTSCQDPEESTVSSFRVRAPGQGNERAQGSGQDREALALPSGILHSVACRRLVTTPPGGSAWAAMLWTLLRFRGASDTECAWWGLPDPRNDASARNLEACGEALRTLSPQLADDPGLRYDAVTVGPCRDLRLPIQRAFEASGPILLGQPGFDGGMKPYVAFQMGFDPRGFYLWCLSADPGDQRARAIRLETLDRQRWMAVVPCWSQRRAE